LSLHSLSSEERLRHAPFLTVLRERERERERESERAKERESLQCIVFYPRPRSPHVTFRPRSSSAHPNADHQRPASMHPPTLLPPPRTPTRCRCDRRKPCNIGLEAAAHSPCPCRQQLRTPQCTPPAQAQAPPATSRPGTAPTPPLQRRRAPARHRTVPRPRAWVARASTKQSTPGPRPLNRSLSGANRSPGRSCPVCTP